MRCRVIVQDNRVEYTHPSARLIRDVERSFRAWSVNLTDAEIVKMATDFTVKRTKDVPYNLHGIVVRKHDPYDWLDDDQEKEYYDFDLDIIINDAYYNGD